MKVLKDMPRIGGFDVDFVSGYGFVSVSKEGDYLFNWGAFNDLEMEYLDQLKPRHVGRDDSARLLYGVYEHYDAIDSGVFLIMREALHHMAFRRMIAESC